MYAHADFGDKKDSLWSRLSSSSSSSSSPQAALDGAESDSDASETEVAKPAKATRHAAPAAVAARKPESVVQASKEGTSKGDSASKAMKAHEVKEIAPSQSKAVDAKNPKRPVVTAVKSQTTAAPKRKAHGNLTSNALKSAKMASSENPKAPEVKGAAVRKMLTNLGLEQYADVLVEEHGFEQVAAWILSATDLIEKCGVKVGHANAILVAARSESEQSKSKPHSKEPEDDHTGATL